MEWTFDEDSPIYLQIVSQIKVLIASGSWSAGEKIPPVRELAMDAGVNPNTMQKALAELERQGVLYSQRTAGRFVSESEEKMTKLQENLVAEQLALFAENMKKLGYDLKDAAKLFEEYCKQSQ